MILVQPVDLTARRSCDDEGHSRPLTPGHELAEAKARLKAGWSTFVCWGCGCGGWRPPAESA